MKTAYQHTIDVANRIKEFGFDVKVANYKDSYSHCIKYDTVFGQINYLCTKETTEDDALNFIATYGLQLYGWTSEKMEQKTNFK